MSPSPNSLVAVNSAMVATESQSPYAKQTTASFSFKIATFTLAFTLSLLTQAARAIPTTAQTLHAGCNVYVNLTSAAPSELFSYVQHGVETPRPCGAGDSTPQAAQAEGQQRLCPFELMNDTDSLAVIDPKRIPREIRQARCLRLHCGQEPQGAQASSPPCCQEHYITIPVMHCDKDPSEDSHTTCTLSLQEIADSCICVRSPSAP